MGNFESLEEEVIKTGRCAHCGACISVCPDYNIKWGLNDSPRRDKAKGMCKDCTECYDSCHMVMGHFMNDQMEEFVFGRTRKDDEKFGIYRKVIAAQATDEEILENAQDGGVATAIGLYLLENNKVDGIITTGREKINGSWKPISMIARNRDDLLASSGTKYYIAPILKMLKEGVIDLELDRLAIIGLPCQIRSARYLQKIEFDLAPAMMELIGLFCTNNYDYDKFSTALQEKGANMKNVEKLEVKSGFFSARINGVELNLALRDMKEMIPSFCEYCDDYSAEFADISIGSQGSGKGWSTIIIRSERGEKLIVEVEKEGYIILKKPDDIEIIASNSKKKYSKARKIA